ncbi:MAG: ABC transporter substrate-binding protein [Actinomycetes bacterium]
MTEELDHGFHADMDRRNFIQRSAVTASGVALAGAGADFFASAAGAVTTNGRGRDGVNKGKPKHGGNLVIGVDAEEQGFNPSTGRFDTTGFLYARAVFDPLMIVTEKGSVKPYLAKSMTSNASHTVWTITLRDGIKFHDGTPLNAEALLLNMDKQYTSFLTGIALKPLIASYKVSGPMSVEVTMKHPWSLFPYTLAEQQICFVAAPSMLNAPDGGTTKPVGTGPFVFKEWVQNDHFTAVRNKNYWRKGLPYLDSVTFKPIPDAQARGQALQTGQIDIMHMPTARVIKQFRGNKKYSYRDNSGKMVGAPSVNCVMLNLAKAPFNDKVARQILANGVDRSLYSKVIDLGICAPASGVFQPGSPYYGKTSYPAFNPKNAQKLADAYKKKHGKALAFTLNVVNAPQTIQSGSFLQQEMKKIGVKVTMKTLQQNELINDALFGSFEATEWSQFGGVTPDTNYVWWSTETAVKNGLSINMARNIDPRLQKALLEGLGAANKKTQIRAFAKVNEYLAEDLPYIFTDRTVWAIVSRPNVQNWATFTSPDGTRCLGQDQGDFWFTQIWKS